MADTFELDASKAEAAVLAMKDAIERLPSPERAAQRVKFLAMLAENPGRLFCSKLKLAGARSANVFESGRLEPSQFHLDAIAAVAAGKLDWEVE